MPVYTTEFYFYETRGKGKLIRSGREQLCGCLEPGVQGIVMIGYFYVLTAK